jgi:hypothetical protein
MYLPIRSPDLVVNPAITALNLAKNAFEELNFIASYTFSLRYVLCSKI